MPRFQVALLAAVLASANALAGAELLLEDGQVLAGVAVERRETLYFLELETGNVLPVPIELVSEVRLTGEDAPAPTGLRVSEPQTLAGPPDGPRLPDPAKMLAAFGDRPARFRRDLIDPRWQPASDWDDDPALNDFNPSRWYEAPIDPTWKPRSAFAAADDVTQFNPARWYRSPIDPTWWPSDGFRRDDR